VYLFTSLAETFPMKTIEIRRHTYRTKPGQHLSQQGVTLARRVGEGIGPFDRVITSTVPRAFETAIAMGFAVDEQVELMSSVSNEVEFEVPWPQSPAVYASAIRNGEATAQYANQLADFYHQLVNDLPDGSAALVINHGGIAEMGAVACLPDVDHASWGPHFECCEGVRLFWEGEKFVKVEILRV
jgi:broad specificity phosphatase PhoE